MIFSITTLQDPCEDGFLGLEDSCIKFPNNFSRNYTVYEAAQECFNERSTLMTFKSNETMNILLNDIVPYLPYNIKQFGDKKWFGGIFINPYGLIQSTASGEFL